MADLLLARLCVAPNNARKTLGYDEFPKLGLSRREKARTLGYHQLPNGDINPTALGAPLTLAPSPVILGLALPAPPRPRPRQHLQLVPRLDQKMLVATATETGTATVTETGTVTGTATATVTETEALSSRSLAMKAARLETLPVSKLVRATDLPPDQEPVKEPQPEPEPDSPAPPKAISHRRVAQLTPLRDSWFVTAYPPPSMADEIDFEETQPRGSRARSIAVRTLAVLTLLGGIAGAIYVAETHPEAQKAVASWATLGQLK